MVADTRERIGEVAAALATEMGAGWAPVSDEWRWRVTGPDDEGIHLYANRGRGKIYASGVYPQRIGESCLPYNEHVFEVACSLTRTPGAIAKDVARRLMPEYRRQLAIARERAASSDEYAAKKQAIVGRLVAAGGVRLEWAHDSRVNFPNGVHMSATGDDVRLEFFYCSVDQALAIVEIMRAKGVS